jgi:hypothetical protein
MFQAIRRHVNATSLVAVIALVFAMSGGAYAAKRYLITSTKQISPSVLKKLKGANGKPGANGANGAVGATGPAGSQGSGGSQGATGPAGAPGKEGPAGAPGAPGKEGPEGQPWTPNNTLPTGATETGTWSAPAGAESDIASISFPIQLAGTLASDHTHYITVAEAAGTLPEGCAGNAEEPVAEPGFLCVFEGGLSSPVGGAELALLLKPGASGFSGAGAGKTGATLLIIPSSPESHFLGSWAVRAG